MSKANTSYLNLVREMRQHITRAMTVLRTINEVYLGGALDGDWQEDLPIEESLCAEGRWSSDNVGEPEPHAGSPEVAPEDLGREREHRENVRVTKTEARLRKAQGGITVRRGLRRKRR